MVEVHKLIWDQWNIEHIARHGITPEEVVEVCQNKFIILDGKKGRFLIIGETNKRKLLAIILDPESEEGSYYVVTARRADQKERKLYSQKKGGVK